MKKKFIYVSLFLTFSVFTLNSCGGSSEPKDEIDTELDMTEETSEVEEEPEKLDLSSISSANEAMDEYKTMLEKYADLVKSGSKEEAEALKAQLDELKSFSEGKWGSSALKAMTDLSKFAIQLEAGKDVDLDDAFKAYDKSLEVLKNMPGVDAETEEVMKESKEAMQQLKSLGF